MINYYYDDETDTLYVHDGDGFEWLPVFFLMAVPLFILAGFLIEYAEFVHVHMWFSTILFLIFSALTGLIAYRKKQVRHKGLGIAASVLSLSPVWMAQICYAIPYILAHDLAFGMAFEWLIITFFTVGLSFFIIQISLLYKNGARHLLIACIYCALAAIIIL